MGPLTKHPQYEERIEQFFENLPKQDLDISKIRLSYVGVKKDRSWNLFRARLDFNPLPQRVPPPVVDLDHVRANTLHLGAANVAPRDLVEQFRSGTVEIEGRIYAFTQQNEFHHFVDLTKDVYLGEVNRPVVCRLQVAGQPNNELWDYSAVQLDLKGQPDFHGSLEELLSRYGLRQEFGSAAVWLYALPKAQVVQAARVDKLVEIQVALRPGYETDLVTLAVSSNGNLKLHPPISIKADQLFPLTKDTTPIVVAKIPDLSDPEIVVMYDQKVQQIARPAFQHAAFPQYLSLDPQFDYVRIGEFGEQSDSHVASVFAKDGATDPAPLALRRQRRKPILRSVSNRLHTMSRNQCAFDGCTQEIYEGGAAMGNVCHIRSPKRQGPRFDALQSDDDCRAYENLILLCRNHHGLVDSDVETYTVERLLAMKATHETNDREPH